MTTLKQLGKSNYSYLMLKPDSRERFNDILMELDNQMYKIIKMYYLDPFYPNATIPYENKKNNYDYYQAIRAHLYLTSLYFGNHGLLAIIDINDRLSLEAFKKEIRKKYTLGESNSSQMLVNLDAFNEFDYSAPRGELYVSSADGYEKVPFYKKLDGKWTVATMNMLHAPDDHGEYLNDINMFYNHGIISDINTVSDEGLAIIKKYKTYERIR